MNAGMDIEFVREHYRKLSDDELVRIFTSDASGFTEQALIAAKEEIQRRGLDTNIVIALEAQQKQYTPAEIDDLCERLRVLPCPWTQDTSRKLNATVTIEVISLLFFSQTKEKLVIACPDVLDKFNNKALAITLVLGWWAIPWGIIKTVKGIRRYFKNKKLSRLNQPNEYLRDFVTSHIGFMEVYKDDRGKLIELIVG